jgi:parallel beta-helix repeat protein
MPRILGLWLPAALAALLLLAASASEAMAEHVQCGDVITQDTTLDSDLVDCPDDGLVIGADNVTLDLGGHTVDGDGVPTEHPLGCEAGIANGPWSHCPRSGGDSHHGVTIRNGQVREFFYGVHLLGTDRNAVRKLTVSATAVGIAVLESTNALVELNRAVGNAAGYDATGIVLSEVSKSAIRKNDLSQNGAYGLHAEGVLDNTIERNTMGGNGNAGMHLHSARRNVVAGNWAIGNSTQGIELSDGASDNLVVDNLASGNGSAGILVFDGVHRNRVERNRVLGNARGLADVYSGGIVVWDDAIVRHNLVSGNGRGIVVCCLDGTVVEQNRVSGNEVGIAIEFSSGNLIARNRVVRSVTNGIEVISHEHVPADGNRIEDNDVKRSGSDGILVTPALSGTAGTLLSRNFTVGNADDGIDVEEPATTLSGNRANRNSDFGIEAVAGVTDGGGNRAFRNGNPLQCLNVACS